VVSKAPCSAKYGSYKQNRPAHVHERVSTKSFRRVDDRQLESRITQAHRAPYVGRYTRLPSPILYDVWHTKRRSVDGCVLRNGRAIVLQWGRLCKWERAIIG